MKHGEGNALGGARIVVTRPAGSASPLAARIRRMGGHPIVVPGLSLRAPEDIAAARSGLLAAAGSDAAIFTSPAAVRFAQRLEPDLARHIDRAFAIGAGTARALARIGIAAETPTGGADSEALLAMPALADVRDRRIALIGAPGGRDLIAPTLAARGAKVERVDVYRRAPPRLTQRHFAALTAAAAPLVTLVSSAEALGHLVDRLPPPLLARLRAAPLVVSSARLADIARGLGFEAVAVARSALAGDLIHATLSLLARS